ncbi:DUF1707 SHOCT-like domain-containing protein [Stackebrandtia nassauensis]|uniref:DUF1707 domain-containing protein n=1 Tax=Stackebrandtia nassauensis (strain DSM 44728 / CIP 108903 / NRRL B-16338 / NBRC 102104 / LLR-40K-21) TaxID=446470 RepID=D3QBA2_STANL|nr:DUF1707 domain-containing protein [Stackebrandtia nassauensis]ADD40919.1 protein of unknown function DUF1707 [Stackebrandtia nassauensis DSM 44728]
MPSQEPSIPAVPERDKRAGDTDRQRVADRLRAALDEGRLELSEYDERLQQTYAAKTYADLDTLLADIPGVAPVSASQVEPVADKNPHRYDDREHRRRKRRNRDKSIKQTWSGVGGATIFFTGLWAIQWIATGGSAPYFWPIWIFGFWALGAACATWAKLMKD